MNEKNFALPEPQLRVSDVERETVATRLREAATEGRLSLDEADERQTLAYAARTRDDLAVLTADLPAPVRAPVQGGWGTLSTAAKRRLGVHVAIVAVIAVGLIARWAFGMAPWFWPGWPMLWLSISVLVHYGVASRRSAAALTAAAA